MIAYCNDDDGQSILFGCLHGAHRGTAGCLVFMVAFGCDVDEAADHIERVRYVADLTGTSPKHPVSQRNRVRTLTDSIKTLMGRQGGDGMWNGAERALHADTRREIRIRAVDFKTRGIQGFVLVEAGTIHGTESPGAGVDSAADAGRALPREEASGSDPREPPRGEAPGLGSGRPVPGDVPTSEVGGHDFDDDDDDDDEMGDGTHGPPAMDANSEDETADEGARVRAALEKWNRLREVRAQVLRLNEEKQLLQEKLNALELDLDAVEADLVGLRDQRPTLRGERRPDIKDVCEGIRAIKWEGSCNKN